jgi:amino acid adenylation domain-containing protein
MKITVCLIGEGSLLVRCGKILLERGHRIVAIVTSISKVQDWAKKNNIICLSNVSELFSIQFKFDYLFSIVNDCILDSSVTELARCAAINYHDAPLPKYAGLNATSWALMNGEKMHGVTWHLMDQNIDTGNIVSQRFFTIDPKDTALSLNLKCYQEAIYSFECLLADIEKNKLNVRKQIIGKRTYYSKDHLLPHLGFIDFYSQSAEDILRIYKALAMGPQPNYIGTLKIYLLFDYLIVSKLEATEEKPLSNVSPGTLFSIKKASLYITTQKKSIKILEFLTRNGTVLMPKDVLSNFGIDIGYQFPKLNYFYEGAAQRFYKAALRKEKKIINNLISFKEHTVYSAVGQSDAGWIAEPTLDCKDIYSYKIDSFGMLAAVLIYFYRLNNYEAFSTFLVHPEFHQIKNKFSGLFSIISPFLFKIPDHSSTRDVLHFIDRSNLMNFPLSLTDLKLRYPELRAKNSVPSIVINFNGVSLDPSLLPEETILYIQINEQTSNIQIFYRPGLQLEPKTNLLITHCNGHIRKIILEALNNIDTDITRLNFLTSLEKKSLLAWGSGRNYSVPNISITELFEMQAAFNPDQIAIIFNEQSITYEQLRLMSDKVAQYISDLGYASQYFIGIYLNRSIEMIAIILGILKVNAAYVPIDVNYPSERIKQIIKKTRMRILITQEVFLDSLRNLSQTQSNPVVIASDRSILESVRQTCQDAKFCVNSLDQLAYIMFTSGTTGNPKGVRVTQRNLLNYCYWFLDTTQFNSGNRIDFSSSIAFDLSVPCSIAPLLRGGGIAICSEPDKLDPKNYLKHLIKHRVTHVEITPGYLNLLLKYPKKIRELKSLRYLLIGADTLQKSDIIKWMNLCPEHILINEYGPTETTVAVTAYFIKAHELAYQTSIPIGSPAYNTQCYVLDKYNNLCLPGMAGELHIAGAQVSLGYLNQGDITRQKFINVEIATKEKVYKTGDIVTWLPDGNLQFLGRADRQVKIEGYRIELSEIEFALGTMPGIQQALVTLGGNKAKTGHLTAYLVCNKQFKNDRVIRKFLSLRLPKFMIPREFIIVSKLPLKENEKIDYNALEKIDKTIIPSLNKQGNGSDIGKTIQRIWQQVLNTPIRMQAETNFFHLGGDSLAAIQIIDTLQRRYAVDLGLHSLFKYPTVSQLETEISRLLAVKRNKVKTAKLSCRPLSIVPLAKGRSKYPLFLIHPVGGTLFWYYPMAALLKGEYTIYGVQDPNVDNHTIHFSSIFEMANFYIYNIKKVQPYSETYYIAGASFGATVAFEMANQLLQENKRIAFLGLLDGWAYYPELLMQTSVSTSLSQQFLFQKITQRRKEQLLALEIHRKKLLDEYTVPFINLNVHLFKAEELWPVFKNLPNGGDNGWRPHVGGEIIIHSVPGNHETMFFNPNVSSLVKCIKPHLYQADT